jgi:hypothetical protein
VKKLDDPSIIQRKLIQRLKKRLVLKVSLASLLWPVPIVSDSCQSRTADEKPEYPSLTKRLFNDIDRKLTVFVSKLQASKVFIRGSAMSSVGIPPPSFALGQLESEIRTYFGTMP